MIKYRRDPIADPPDPIVEVERIHRAVEQGRRGPNGMPMPTWLAGLCAHWLAEARREDVKAGHTGGPIPGDREGLALVLVEEALTALDLSIRKGMVAKGGDYTVEPIQQGNGTIVLQLVPGKLVPVLLPKAELEAVLTIVNELVEKPDSIYWTPEAIRAEALLARALNTYTDNEGR